MAGERVPLRIGAGFVALALEDLAAARPAATVLVLNWPASLSGLDAWMDQPEELADTIGPPQKSRK